MTEQPFCLVICLSSKKGATLKLFGKNSEIAAKNAPNKSFSYGEALKPLKCLWLQILIVFIIQLLNIKLKLKVSPTLQSFLCETKAKKQND